MYAYTLQMRRAPNAKSQRVLVLALWLVIFAARRCISTLYAMALQCLSESPFVNNQCCHNG